MWIFVGILFLAVDMIGIFVTFCVQDADESDELCPWVGPVARSRQLGLSMASADLLHLLPAFLVLPVVPAGQSLHDTHSTRRDARRTFKEILRYQISQDCIRMLRGNAAKLSALSLHGSEGNSRP